MGFLSYFANSFSDVNSLSVADLSPAPRLAIRKWASLKAKIWSSTWSLQTSLNSLHLSFTLIPLEHITKRFTVHIHVLKLQILNENFRILSINGIFCLNMCVKLPSRLSRYKREHASTISSMAPLLAALGPICCISILNIEMLRVLFTQGFSSQIRIVMKFNVLSKISSKRKKFYEMNYYRQ